MRFGTAECQTRESERGRQGREGGWHATVKWSGMCAECNGMRSASQRAMLFRTEVGAISIVLTRHDMG